MFSRMVALKGLSREGAQNAAAAATRAAECNSG